MMESRNALSAGAGSHSGLRRVHSSSLSIRPVRIEMRAGELADAAIELPIGQAQAIGQAVALEDLVPAIDAGLAVADVPVAQHLVHRVAHRNLERATTSPSRTVSSR